jgi:hypothetical protein
VLAASVSFVAALFVVEAPPASSAVTCFGRVPTIVGTPGPDVLTGTPGTDVIAGLGGDDVIDGGGGRDFICGGPGRDRIDGGTGPDAIAGDGGGDVLVGGKGRDRLLGGRGRDRMIGGGGEDRLKGGVDPDRASGGVGIDTCTAETQVGCELPPRPYVSLYPPPALPGSETASGSGCLVGTGPLGDGYWFGYAVSRLPGGITFDAACFFFGDAAEAAAAADGATIEDPYYIRNQSTQLRTIAIGPSVPAYAVDFGCGDFAALTFSSWPQTGGLLPCPGPGCRVWITIAGGKVNGLVEQFVP